VLDLGKSGGSAAVYLADRGARVSVDPFEPDDSPSGSASEGNPGPGGMTLPHPDASFDLVLAWEHGDFLSPDRLPEFGREIRRILAPGGALVLYSQDATPSGGMRHDRPAYYELTDDDKLVRTAATGPARPRWAHSNRMIEQALSPLAVQSIHLQRNRVREFVVNRT
jgi:SAM-dependent methyltransferase